LGEYHAVVHVDQGLLKFLCVVAFLLDLRELVDCFKAVIADLDQGINIDFPVGLEADGEVSKAVEDLRFELAVIAVVHDVDEFLEDGAEIAGDSPLVAAGDVGDAVEGGLEGRLLVDAVEPLHHVLPVFLELVLQELAFEGDGQGADHVDALLLDAVDAEVQVDEFVDLVLDVDGHGELGEGQQAGVDDRDDLRQHDLLVGDLGVGRVAVEPDEVVDQHQQHCLLRSRVEHVHDDDGDLLV
jgi:hypothetical protein